MSIVRFATSCVLLALGHALGAAPAALGQTPLSLEDALREARAANARLPVSSLDISISREKLGQAQAERWLRVALEGDFLYAPASGYDPVLTNLGEARGQIVARQPLYAGGALKAGVVRADAEVAAAGARYRVAVRDLELEVRSRYDELLAARAEAAARREGVERLTTYRTSLQSRQASGQGVAADVLKTQVRLALEEASIADAEQRADDARLALNQALGREPGGPLELAPLPPPETPSPGEPAPWEGAPEIEAAEAETRAAEAQLAIARAERLPHVSLNADTGFWVSDTTHLSGDFWDRFWGAKGYSLSLTVAWPLWDRGGLRARIAEADLGVRSAQAKLEAQRRDARLAWSQARAAQEHLFRQIEILSRATPDARDSYLQIESRYRGGTATALEVLDAYAAAVDAQVRLNEVIARYRIAQAVSLRWSEP
ncbi:MAG TPA: TolC family protein [Thermoanaerobaculia bacterium]